MPPPFLYQIRTHLPPPFLYIASQFEHCSSAHCQAAKLVLSGMAVSNSLKCKLHTAEAFLHSSCETDQPNLHLQCVRMSRAPAYCHTAPAGKARSRAARHVTRGGIVEVDGLHAKQAVQVFLREVQQGLQTRHHRSQERHTAITRHARIISCKCVTSATRSPLEREPAFTAWMTATHVSSSGVRFSRRLRGFSITSPSTLA